MVFARRPETASGAPLTVVGPVGVAPVSVSVPRPFLVGPPSVAARREVARAGAAGRW